MNEESKMILIADSGSTKTDWCLTDEQGTVASCATQGINPFQQSEDTIAAILADELVAVLPCVPHAVTHIYFYGAGCRDEMIPAMRKTLHGIFSKARTIEVHSDLMGAARALFADRDGIACILGTGSNSCLYVQGKITANISPLGYILGDEGSGAVLGKRLVNALYKGQLPRDLQTLFEQEMQLSLTDIINKVYRQPLANRFLASLSPFVSKHIDEPSLEQLVKDNFDGFFVNNINLYHTTHLPLGAVGSIACHYSSQLKAVASAHGYHVGRIITSPIHALTCYHREQLKRQPILNG